VGNESSTASVEFQDVLRELEELRASRGELEKQAETYRRLYLEMLETCKRLERGLIGQKAERLPPNEKQLALQLLGSLLEDSPGDSELPQGAAEEAAANRPRKQRKPTGRKPLPEHLPRVQIEILPEEVQQKGLEAFEQIGVEVSEMIERRPASLVLVEIRRPKFVPKGRVRSEPTAVRIGPTLDLPIERSVAGPALLADTIVRRWQDHCPLHRLESIYARERLQVARSTMCGWHAQLADLVRPLIDAMWRDSFTSSYLCVDATGVLVRAPKQCSRGHFWVMIAPDRHVLFRYSSRHNSEAVDRILEGYAGYLVADAHSVYDHLYASGRMVEVACWAHARRYYFKALSSDPERARIALALIGELFRIERDLAPLPSRARRLGRHDRSRPIVGKYFAWCEQQQDAVLDETPIASAFRYSMNQRVALERFLEDGRLPLHNNGSELQLRRQVLGRRNWLFLGSEDAAEVNTSFVSLLASCQLHQIEPLNYLRDLFCLLPTWPHRRVLELAPACWTQTLQDPQTQKRLDSHPLRQVALGRIAEHRGD